MGALPPPGPVTVGTRGRGHSGGHKTCVFSCLPARVESANSLQINDDEFCWVSRLCLRSKRSQVRILSGSLSSPHVNRILHLDYPVSGHLAARGSPPDRILSGSLPRCHTQTDSWRLRRAADDSQPAPGHPLSHRIPAVKVASPPTSRSTRPTPKIWPE
jgi:hypothetical protein